MNRYSFYPVRHNGGDGIVVARYLKQAGYRDLVFPLGKPKSASAREHFRYYQSLGLTYQESVNEQAAYDVIIDAILGVGTRLPLKDDCKKIVEWCNRQDALKIAIDMPTGVESDSGETPLAFRADYTFSLHGFKPSAFLLPSAEYYGKTAVVDIGLPHHSNWKVWTEQDVKETMTRRQPFSHKGTFGTGLLIAGTDEMPGSALLAGLGAMKSGIGKLMIGTSPFVAGIIASQVPEATYWFNGLEKLAAGQMPDGIRGAAIGPGLSDKDLVMKAIERLWSEPIPLILDAGALLKRTYPKRQAPVIITPHPGEFHRLTGIRTKEIQSNRIESAGRYAKEHGVITVLKGAYTVIAFPDGTGIVNRTGNTGLAKGGSGDTLTGMLLAMVCTTEDISVPLPMPFISMVYVRTVMRKKKKTEPLLPGISPITWEKFYMRF